MQTNSNGIVYHPGGGSIGSAGDRRINNVNYQGGGSRGGGNDGGGSVGGGSLRSNRTSRTGGTAGESRTVDREFPHREPPQIETRHGISRRRQENRTCQNYIGRCGRYVIRYQDIGHVYALNPFASKRWKKCVFLCVG